MKVLVCGSRSRRDYETMISVHRRLAQLPAGSEVLHRERDPLDQDTFAFEVLHGGARGPDTFAAESARDLGMSVRPFLPDWRLHGKRAGIVRNLEMLDEQPDLVLAFWDGTSRGTKHTIDEAKRRGIPVEVL